ncbi:hypothetical protein vseg_004864 [Gypsophila vaccaria]
MESINIYGGKSDGFTVHSHWLQDTVSDVNDKMKDIVNLLDENDFSTQRKQAITQIVTDLCISYASLARDHELLKLSTSEHFSNPIFSPSDKHNNTKSNENWDDSPPESTIEDPEIEIEGDTHTTELEENKFIADNLTPAEDETVLSKDECRIVNSEEGVFHTAFKCSKIVEESGRVQMELIRRNSEKREMILELQDQVTSLMAEKDALLHKLSYCERYFQANSTNRRIRVKFFRCS